MKIKAMVATATSKSVAQDTILRGLGVTIISAGLAAFQGGVTVEEKGLGAIVMIVGLAVFSIKDVLKAGNNPIISAAKLKQAGKGKK